MDVRLVIQQGAKRRQTFHLRKDEMIIGRRRGAGLRIPSAEVSRRHCRLYVEDGVLMVEDLNSINGTTLNHVLVEGCEVVRPGDELQVGPVLFVVEYELSTAAFSRLQSPDLNGEVEVLVELAEDDLEETELMELEFSDSGEEMAELEPIEVEEDAPELEPLEDGVMELALEGESAADDEQEIDWDLPLESDEEEAPSKWSDERFEKSGPLELPEDEGFRDFLSQLDDDAE